VHAVTPKVSGGYRHALALSENGQIFGWGDNNRGQLGFGKVLSNSTPLPVAFLNPVTSVQVANTHALALDTTGKVWSWGKNESGQLGDGKTADRSKPAIVFSGAMQIAASMNVSLAIDTLGSVWEWGNGTLNPTKVQGISSASRVSSSLGTKIVVDQVGRVWTWGDGQNGKLGDGQTSSRSVPQIVIGVPAIRHIEIGRWHVLAVDVNGGVWAWGWTYGINGDSTGVVGSTSRVYTKPIKLTGLPQMAVVGAGTTDNYGVGTDGTFYTWTGDPSTYRKFVQEPMRFANLSVGDYHGLALDTSGKVWAWGNNSSGQIGPDPGGNFRQIPTNQLVRDISASDSFFQSEGTSFFVTSSGQAFGLGSNQALQLSIPSEITSRSNPNRISSLQNAIDMSVRRDSSFVLLSDGSLYGWGSNDYCELGTISGSGCGVSPTPLKLSAPSNLRKISFGGVSLSGLDDRGVVWAIGGGNLPSPTAAANLPPAIELARGGFHTAIIANDHTVWTWGSNWSGQMGTGTFDQSDLQSLFGPLQVPGLKGVVQVAAGQDFTVVLDQQGDAWAWGSNSGGNFGFQTISSTSNFRSGVATPVKVRFLRKVQSIFAGEAGICGVLEDGSAQCFGHQFRQEAGMSFHFNNPIDAISVGGYSTHFLLKDGTVRAIGANDRGQVGDGTFVARSEPALVIGENANAPLLLRSNAPNKIAPGQSPVFFTLASGDITANSASISNTATFNPSSIGKLGAVYVTASVPTSSLTSLAVAQNAPNVLFSGVPRPAQMAGTTSTGFTLIQLTPTGWQTVVNGQLIPYATGVLGDQLAAQTILNGADTANLKGAEFCVGYGTDAKDMINNGNIRAVATIPGATTPSTCAVGTTLNTSIAISPGWNLLGNPINQIISVSEKFGDATKISSVWKWDAAKANWQFYAPGMSATDLSAYAAGQNYAVLTEISPGDGYWVNAKVQADLGSVSGSAVYLRQSSLASGWNLVSTASPISAKDFNLNLSTTPPTAGLVPINMTSLWAWDNARSNWYFYAPSLEAQSGTALSDYINSNGFEDFTSSGKTLGNGIGIWVNRP
jgi:alpha-tubulin suppressor-like RCC1 family protein